MKKGSILLMAALMTLAVTGCDSSDYKKATALYDEGQYAEAESMFEELGDYEDSADMLNQCKYAEAEEYLAAEDYDSAEAVYAELGEYEDCASKVSECEYHKAEALCEAENYEEAITILQGISGYGHADSLCEEAEQKLMLQQYGDVIEALQKETWYFNGGSDTILDRISFTDSNAVIGQVYFDGNGKHEDTDIHCEYKITDSLITVNESDGTSLSINYSMDGDTVTLGDGEYYTLTEIDDAIQGYWKVKYTSSGLSSEYNIHFDNGKVTAESATEVYGAYYNYFGPYEGTYSVKFGSFKMDIMHGGDWFYNIIDGKPTILYYDHVGQPTDKLPGENGY